MWLVLHFQQCAHSPTSGQDRKRSDRAHQPGPDGIIWATTFSIVPLPPPRADAGSPTFRELADRPTRVIRRIAGATMTIRRAVQSWLDLFREDSWLPLSGSRQTGFSLTHRAQRRQKAHPETCVTTERATNVRGRRNASRSNHRRQA